MKDYDREKERGSRKEEKKDKEKSSSSLKKERKRSRSRTPSKKEKRRSPPKDKEEKEEKSKVSVDEPQSSRTIASDGSSSTVMDIGNVSLNEEKLQKMNSKMEFEDEESLRERLLERKLKQTHKKRLNFFFD
ncbi:hypothetical protein Mgra_00009572 [Meloidogyne graminicola]|uniref:Uncharacterized protein n=1 Tax=Meloidogyne graminicola TaxID=189291 RepID=A0A8S9ZB66_9BILA|nr:hypothetical protein Mgra_00009572 [Meloidogyne graminicola]